MHRLSPPWEGPFAIERVLGNDAYYLSDEEAELERRRDRRGKRRMRIYDDRDDVNMVAAGYRHPL